MMTDTEYNRLKEHLLSIYECANMYIHDDERRNYYRGEIDGFFLCCLLCGLTDKQMNEIIKIKSDYANKVW